MHNIIIYTTSLLIVLTYFYTHFVHWLLSVALDHCFLSVWVSYCSEIYILSHLWAMLSEDTFVKYLGIQKKLKAALPRCLTSEECRLWLEQRWMKNQCFVSWFAAIDLGSWRWPNLVSPSSTYLGCSGRRSPWLWVTHQIRWQSGSVKSSLLYLISPSSWSFILALTTEVSETQLHFSIYICFGLDIALFHKRF